MDDKIVKFVQNNGGNILDYYSDMPKSGPDVPDELKWKPDFNFEQASVQTLADFAVELGIEIPSEFTHYVMMYDMGYFFSSDNTFMPPLTSDGFVDFVKKDQPIIAFGQRGYGFNSGTFDIFYVSSNFGYYFTIQFGGAFTNNEDSARYITGAFSDLRNFINKGSLAFDPAYRTVILDIFPIVKFIKIDRVSGAEKEVTDIVFRQ
ncbi:MAG: hypothetical protein LBJ45_02575 [Holosporaceae bacterium]|jgi:hypothetical protein|nr:hypothetical protein [Holosporaceae bacterium]